MEKEKYWIDYFKIGEENFKIHNLQNDKYIKSLNANDDTYLIALDMHNIELTNFMLAHNSFYNNGKSNVLISELNDKNIKNQIEKILIEINKENRTRVAENDITKMAKVVCKQCNNRLEELKDILKNKSKGVDLIAKMTVIKGNKKNFSLATKFCHYMCYGLFDGNNKDIYSIYDKIVSTAICNYFTYFKQYSASFKDEDLKIYFEQYDKVGCDLKMSEKTEATIDIGKNKLKAESAAEAEEKFKTLYSNYTNLIDKVRCANKELFNEDISRNDLDHLLWYLNK